MSRLSKTHRAPSMTGTAWLAWLSLLVLVLLPLAASASVAGADVPCVHGVIVKQG